MPHRMLVVVVAIALGGCGSAGGGGAAPATATPRVRGNVLMADQLATAGSTSAYDAVNRLRPDFLTAPVAPGGRMGRVQVVIDDVERNADDLRGLSVSRVAFVRLYPSRDAATYFQTTGATSVVYVVTNGFAPRLRLRQ